MHRQRRRWRHERRRRRPQHSRRKRVARPPLTSRWRTPTSPRSARASSCSLLSSRIATRRSRSSPSSAPPCAQSLADAPSTWRPISPRRAEAPSDVTGDLTSPACDRALAQAGKMRRMSQQGACRKPSAAGGGEVIRLSSLPPTRLPSPGLGTERAMSVFERALQQPAEAGDAAQSSDAVHRGSCRGVIQKL